MRHLIFNVAIFGAAFVFGYAIGKVPVPREDKPSPGVTQVAPPKYSPLTGGVAFEELQNRVAKLEKRLNAERTARLKEEDDIKVVVGALIQSLTRSITPEVSTQ